MSQQTRIWKEKPPGAEQMLLEEMFGTGSIMDYATPEAVRQTSELFKAFPARTFAVHFRKTKAKMGEFVSSVRGIQGGVIAPSPTTVKDAINKIPELGTNVAQPLMKRSCPTTCDVPVEIVNPPFNTWQYSDHDVGTDYVCVAINIFTGSNSVSFDITEDGFKIIVRFAWPTAMYKAVELFEKDIQEKKISKHHPMIHAMSSSMLASGITENSKPEGQWIIHFPCKVRREVSSQHKDHVFAIHGIST